MPSAARPGSEYASKARGWSRMVERTLRGMLMLLVVALVGCDHATKAVAKVALEGSAPRAIIPGVLDLVYTENRDTAFSMLRHVTSPAKGPVILVLSCLAITAVMVAWWRRRRTAGLVEHLAFVAIVGGAVANVTDRLARGYVVDFIHVRLWPVFNVADVAICVGCGLLGVALMRQRGEGHGGPPPSLPSASAAIPTNPPG